MPDMVTVPRDPAAAPADVIDVTTDPNDVPHYTHRPCGATWRAVPYSNAITGEPMGTTTQFGYPPCGEPGALDRFVKAAHADRYIPIYACAEHAR
ncbi:hypothetical protein [Streptomyces sp. NPDC053427]|uniref:hypothetical protein n=1 Tax=Streptomyces sp. NPDC053427 TaxID=3365701 RepID=UPI0037D0100C